MREISTGKYHLAAGSSSLGNLEGQSPQINANPEAQGAGLPSFLRKAYRINA